MKEAFLVTIARVNRSITNTPVELMQHQQTPPGLELTDQPHYLE